MSQTNDKVRLFADAVAWAASTNYPSAFPESRDPDLFTGDMKGAEVDGMSIAFTKTGGAGTLDCKLQHSHDGTNWSDVHATLADFAQLSDTGSEMVDISDLPLLRYVRFVTTRGTTLAGTLTLRLHFRQVYARGRYAPPGYITKAT